MLVLPGGVFLLFIPFLLLCSPATKKTSRSFVPPQPDTIRPCWPVTQGSFHCTRTKHHWPGVSIGGVLPYLIKAAVPDDIPDDVAGAVADAVADDDDVACIAADLWSRAPLKLAGHHVRVTNLYDEGFKAPLGAAEHRGYMTAFRDGRIESDLKGHVEDLQWCSGLVLCYPTWWYSFPAILKVTAVARLGALKFGM